MLVGPWCNQPEQYEGYNGFVGWSAITRLKSGRWLHTFNSGYWHASYPWTEEVAADEGCQKIKAHLDELGCMDIRAPRGGRSHVMYSDDEGLSWSKPVTLVDTDKSDLHATILELDDGSLLCTFCSVSLLPRAVIPQYMRSEDGGETWSDITAFPGNGGGFGNGTAIQLVDGRIVCAVENRIKVAGEEKYLDKSDGINIFISHDRGRTFELGTVVYAGKEVYEPGITELPDGRLVMIVRRDGAVCWSDDGGETWTEPADIGLEIYDPHLIVAPNGVLVCVHGSYKGGGLRVALSPDGGETWRGCADHTGYSVDPTVYGYSHPMFLPDGTMYLTYIHTGGHSSEDARTEALWGIRVRINDDVNGIELLPAPGSPAASGFLTGLENIKSDGGDPELGNAVY